MLTTGQKAAMLESSLNKLLLPVLETLLVSDTGSHYPI